MKLGLALGGGGAKGFAHLGILEVLTEAGIEFDIVAGTSIGAFIGAVYVSDKLQELKNFAVKLFFFGGCTSFAGFFFIVSSVYASSRAFDSTR